VPPPACEGFMTVLTGDLPCIKAHNSNGLKLLARKFKCHRLLTKVDVSPDGDYTLAQHDNVNEWPTHVSNLPLPETDESLESYITALPGGPGQSRASSLQSR
jgi:hypothetical protein